MRGATWIKAGLVGGWALCGVLAVGWSPLSKASTPDKTKPADQQKYKSEDYIGSESCKACHEQQFVNFSKTKHGKLAAAHSWKGEAQGCETCHGPGRLHVEGGGDKSKITAFSSLSPKQISDTCLQCHAGKEEHNNYKRGEHYRNDVACTSCHSPHGEVVFAASATQPSSERYLARKVADADVTTPLKMLRTTEPQLCLQCHSEMKAQFSMPFHHRVPEGSMKCSDCHNPHGGFESKQTRVATGADQACLKCHADKQGPFVFEHAPAKVEGCTICHTPHGSNNASLLKRNQVRQLCIECHSNTGAIGIPNTPNFHNQATTRFQNCTTCHVKIHGSNVNQFFFR
jgi:predicted CXXCH cytochrome family protein